MIQCLILAAIFALCEFPNHIELAIGSLSIALLLSFVPREGLWNYMWDNNEQDIQKTKRASSWK
jgi:hypothetical protein